MVPNSLQTQLQECANDLEVMQVSDFSIGHRGACLQFPEHTLDSYKAAIRMGAGIVECDVTFTKDLQLVCRHAQVRYKRKYQTDNLLDRSCFCLFVCLFVCLLALLCLSSPVKQN
jgi:Glycerophosphoryl diester phosphodiesterase family